MYCVVFSEPVPKLVSFTCFTFSMVGGVFEEVLCGGFGWFYTVREADHHG